MADIILFNRVQALDADGDTLSGAKAYFYETGTTTPLTVYSDEALTTPHARPLVADAGGAFAAVFFDGAVVPKVVVKTSAGATVYTLDPAYSQSTGAVGATNIPFSPTADNTATNVQAAIENLDAFAGSDVSQAEVNLLDGMTGKTGIDPTFVTGTAAVVANHLCKWDANGDVIDGGQDTISEANWINGTSTTETLISPAKLSATIEATAPGYSQTWQDVSGSRVAGTSYQNSTSVPIMVTIGHLNSSGPVQVSSDGSTWVDMTQTGQYQVISFLIPPGHYYRAMGGTFAIWTELS